MTGSASVETVNNNKYCAHSFCNQQREVSIMSIRETISGMSLQDKVAFCTGVDFWQTKKMEKYGIPAMMMADGPHGLRCQKGETDMVGVNKSLPATCFPAAVTAGASWIKTCTQRKGRQSDKKAWLRMYR